MQGIVLKSTGKWYEVKGEDGDKYECQIKGKFRLKGIRTTNPIAAGDNVQFDLEDDGHGVIREIEKRKNYIIRKSVNLSHEAHIVAANLDQAFLIATLVQPVTSTGFIDRFLVTAEAYSVPVVILFNKSDIYTEDHWELFEYYQSVYNHVGHECIPISATTGEGLERVQSKMKGKINLVSGHSGVGKSTLINAIIPGVQIKTAEVSESHSKGVHTTTFAEMHELPEGGFIIDTPGIKGFGLVDIPKEELQHYFPDIFRILPECKFHNCLHLNEPGCAVKLAVEEGVLPEERYINYLAMYHEDEGPYRV